MRHLTQSQALASLGRGAAIEQLLPSLNSREMLEWLCLSPRSAGVYLTRHRPAAASACPGAEFSGALSRSSRHDRGESCRAETVNDPFGLARPGHPD